MSIVPRGLVCERVDAVFCNQLCRRPWSLPSDNPVPDEDAALFVARVSSAHFPALHFRLTRFLLLAPSLPASDAAPASATAATPDQGDVVDGAEAEAEADDPSSPVHREERMTRCRGKIVHGSIVPCQDPSSPHATVMESTYVNGLLVVGRHRIRTAPGKWHYCGLRIPVDEGVKFIDRGSPTCRAILYR